MDSSEEREIVKHLLQIRDGVEALSSEQLRAERERAEDRARVELVQRVVNRLRRSGQDRDSQIRDIYNRLHVLEARTPAQPLQPSAPHPGPVPPSGPVPRSPWWRRLFGIALLGATLFLGRPT